MQLYSNKKKKKLKMGKKKHIWNVLMMGNNLKYKEETNSDILQIQFAVK